MSIPSGGSKVTVRKLQSLSCFPNKQMASSSPNTLEPSPVAKPVSNQLPSRSPTSASESISATSMLNGFSVSSESMQSSMHRPQRHPVQPLPGFPLFQPTAQFHCSSPQSLSTSNPATPVRSTQVIGAFVPYQYTQSHAPVPVHNCSSSMAASVSIDNLSIRSENDPPQMSRSGVILPRQDAVPILRPYAFKPVVRAAQPPHPGPQPSSAKSWHDIRYCSNDKASPVSTAIPSQPPPKYSAVSVRCGSTSRPSTLIASSRNTNPEQMCDYPVIDCDAAVLMSSTVPSSFSVDTGLNQHQQSGLPPPVPPHKGATSTVTKSTSRGPSSLSAQSPSSASVPLPISSKPNNVEPWKGGTAPVPVTVQHTKSVSEVTPLTSSGISPGTPTSATTSSGGDLELLLRRREREIAQLRAALEKSEALFKQTLEERKAEYSAQIQKERVRSSEVQQALNAHTERVHALEQSLSEMRLQQQRYNQTPSSLPSGPNQQLLNPVLHHKAVQCETVFVPGAMPPLESQQLAQSQEQVRQLQQQLQEQCAQLEAERSQWLVEKASVLHFQQQMEQAWVQVNQHCQQLQSQLDGHQQVHGDPPQPGLVPGVRPPTRKEGPIWRHPAPTGSAPEAPPSCTEAQSPPKSASQQHSATPSAPRGKILIEESLC